jgi:hypothetical protein
MEPEYAFTLFALITLLATVVAAFRAPVLWRQLHAQPADALVVAGGPGTKWDVVDFLAPDGTSCHSRVGAYRDGQLVPVGTTVRVFYPIDDPCSDVRAEGEPFLLPDVVVLIFLTIGVTGMIGQWRRIPTAGTRRVAKDAVG